VIGLYANVLVRYLTRDDPAQFAVAQGAIMSAVVRGEQLYICLPVLLEAAWVLSRAYRVDRASLALLVGRLLGASEFVIEREEAVEAALAEFQVGKAGFADCLIAALNTAAGCRHTLSFDADAAAMPAFRLLRA
jgi:predicted nucleic-acid-binding protein